MTDNTEAWRNKFWTALTDEQKAILTAEQDARMAAFAAKHPEEAAILAKPPARDDAWGTNSRVTHAAPQYNRARGRWGR